MSKNKKIGIIQLGDTLRVLETLLSFKNYRKTYPEIQKTIILKMDASIFEIILKEEFDEIIYISSMETTSIEKTEDYFKNKFFSLSFSVLINLTFSKSSAYLSSLINADFKLGFQYSKTNYLFIGDSWSRYVYSVIMGGNLNSFSIVDIFKSIIGNKHPIQNQPRTFEKKILLNLGKDNTCDQLKRIYPEWEMISTNHSIDFFMDPNFNPSLYIGPYSIYSLICTYRGIPCINFYQIKKDTFLYMPYGPKNYSCQTMDYEESLMPFIKNGKNENYLETVQGPGYFIFNHPTIEKPLTLEEIFGELYKYAFLIFIEDLEVSIKVSSLEETSLKELILYEKASKNLQDLVILGKKYSLFIIQELSTPQPDFEKIKGYGAKIDEIDSLSLNLKKTYPYLGPVIEYFYFGRMMIKGTGPFEVTENTYFNFEEYSTFLEIILELINNIKSRFTILEKGK